MPQDRLQELMKKADALPSGNSINKPSSTWGAPRDGGARRHKGYDLSIENNAPYSFNVPARVTNVGQGARRGGNWVELEFDMPDGRKARSRMMHNSRNLVKTGQTVNPGDPVAHVGTTGNAKGPHIHYEWWEKGQPVDPSTVQDVIYPVRAGQSSSAPSGRLAELMAKADALDEPSKPLMSRLSLGLSEQPVTPQPKPVTYPRKSRSAYGEKSAQAIMRPAPATAKPSVVDIARQAAAQAIAAPSESPLVRTMQGTANEAIGAAAMPRRAREQIIRERSMRSIGPAPSGSTIQASQSRAPERNFDYQIGELLDQGIREEIQGESGLTREQAVAEGKGNEYDMALAQRRTERLKVYRDALAKHPELRQLDPQKAANAIRDVADLETDPSLIRGVRRGAWSGMAAIKHKLGNVADLAGKTGLFNAERVADVKGTLHRASQEETLATDISRGRHPEEQGFTGSLAEGVGNLAFAAGPELILTAPLKAFQLPFLGAIGAEDQGVGATAKGAALGYVYHKGMKWTAPLGRVGNALIWTTAPAAESLIENPNQTLGQAVGSALPMGALAAAGGGKRVSVTDGKQTRPATVEDLPAIKDGKLQILDPPPELRVPADSSTTGLNYPTKQIRERGLATIGEQIAAKGRTEPPKAVVRHSDPRIDGGEIVGRASDGRLKVANNEGGTSLVRNPRTQGNRSAAIQKGKPTESFEVPPIDEVLPKPETVVFDSRQGRRAVDLPAQPAEGFVRVYRGEPIPSQEAYSTRAVKDAPTDLRGRWFTTDPQEAADYAAANNVEGGGLMYVDVPAREIPNYRAKTVAGNAKFPFPLRENEFILPPELTQKAVGIPSRSALESEGARPYESQVLPKGASNVLPREAKPIEPQGVAAKQLDAPTAPQPPRVVERVGRSAETPPPSKVEGKEPWEMSQSEFSGKRGVTESEGGNFGDFTDLISSRLKVHQASVREIGNGYSVARADEPLRTASDRRPSDNVQRAKSGAVLLHDGKVVGAFVGDTLAIHPEHRGKNLSQELYRERLKIGAIPDTGSFSRAGFAASKSAHKAFVEEALRQGKPVPREVLKDYPDLKPSAPIRPVEPIRAEREPVTTSARKAQMAEDRAELDLPELPAAERKGWQTSLDNAKEKGLDRQANALADEVLAKPRALNDEETAGLVLRTQQVKNEHKVALKEVEQAKGDEILQKAAKVEALEREFDKLSEATKKSGTEKGRSLASQKLTINEDYDLISVLRRAKAKSGKELKPEVRKQIEDLTKRLEETETRLSKSQEENLKLQAQRTVKRIVDENARERRRTRRATTKEELDTEYAELSTLFRSKLAGRMSANPLDPELVSIIGKIAKNRVRSGITSVEGLVDEIHGAVKDYIDDKRVIRDAISGYGKQTEAREKDPLTVELNRLKTEMRNVSKQEDIESGARPNPRLQAAKTRLTKQITELERKIKESDYSKRARPTVEYDPATRRVQVQRDLLKQQVDAVINRLERQNRPMMVKALEGATNYRRANLLSGIKTHVRNVTSTGIFQVSEEASRGFAAVADRMAARKSGERTTFGINIPEASKAAIKAAITEGPERVKNIMLGREVLPLEGREAARGRESTASKMQLAPSETGSKIVDGYVNTVFRSLEAEDAVFKVFAFRRELADIAKAQARREGRGQERARELQQNPTEEMLIEAATYADYATFQNKNKLSSAIAAGKRQVGPIGQFAIEVIAPFDRTPTNIIARTFENSPLGFISAARKYRGFSKAAEKSAVSQSVADMVLTRQQQKAFARTFGRASTGTILSVLGMALASKGLLTGTAKYQDDKADYAKKQKEAGGGAMLYIPVLDKYVYIGDTPAGKAMATAAAIYEEITREPRKSPEARAKDTTMSRIGDAAKSIGRIALEQPLAEGTSRLLDRPFDEALADYLSSYTPASSLMKAAGEVIDEKPRRVYGQGPAAQFKDKIPFLRKQLPVDERVSTEERGGVGRRLIRGVDPFNTTSPGEGKEIGNGGGKYKDLRARSYRGEDISAELDKLVRSGEMTVDTAKKIWSARNKTQSVEDFKQIKTLEQAEEEYNEASSEEQKLFLPILEKKRERKREDMGRGFQGRGTRIPQTPTRSQ